MSVLDDLTREPWSFDLLGTLRLIERSHPGAPRIGDSATRGEEYVALGEDPFLAFPASNLSRAVKDGPDGLRLFVRFLGLLGPHGPLPLATTDETYGWWVNGHEGFARFLDLLNHRFLQLFFRAWADARPIAQADRPDLDRFVLYIGSAVGIGTPPYRDRDAVSDAGKLAFAGLLAPKAHSASRLAQAVAGLFEVRCEVREFVGTRLVFDRADRTHLGRTHARLGQGCLLGASVYSVEDKIGLRLYARDLPDYERFLPTGAFCTPLADLLFHYLGHELDCDVELALPRAAVPPLRLSGGARLGYTTWLGPGAAPDRATHEDTDYRCDARFNPAERARRSPHHADPTPTRDRARA